MENMLQTLTAHSNEADNDWTNDETFLNQHQIWPTFSQAVATELSLETGAGSLTPVPKLEEYSEAFKPLQVYRHEKDLIGTTVTKLKKRQIKIVHREEPKTQDGDLHQRSPHAQARTRYDILSRIRSPFKQKYLKETAVNLDDILRISNIVAKLTFNQSTSRIRNPSIDGVRADGSKSLTHYLNVQTRSMQFTIEDVYARKFDARKLLGCRLKTGKSRPWRVASSVRIILETYFASRVHCCVKYATNFPGHATIPRGEWKREVEIQHCPIAFRYAYLKLDRDGIIDDVTMPSPSSDDCLESNTHFQV